MHEVKIWIDTAERDFKIAQSSFESGNYYWASFQAQQAAEKALKGLNIKKHKQLIRSHDLVFLARRANVPQRIVKICGKINPCYIDTRYPDLAREYGSKEASEILNFAEKILEWIKKNL